MYGFWTGKVAQLFGTRRVQGVKSVQIYFVIMAATTWGPWFHRATTCLYNVSGSQIAKGGGLFIGSRIHRGHGWWSVAFAFLPSLIFLVTSCNYGVEVDGITVFCVKTMQSHSLSCATTRHRIIYLTIFHCEPQFGRKRLNTARSKGGK